MEVSVQRIASILTILYLPGVRRGPALHRQRWVEIEHLLRQHATNLDAAEDILCEHGFWMEAAALRDCAGLELAERLLLGRRVLTANMEQYPVRWLQVLGALAPPALWVHGAFPSAEFLTVVGSRYTSSAALKFAENAGSEAVDRGFVLASGGAFGCDRAAARGALKASKAAGSEVRVLEILPFGIDLPVRRNTVQLSLVAPREEFSGPAAMERNRLLYALSERSLVAAVRFKEGGTWRGACECLRRKSSNLFVREDGSEGFRALCGLGAQPVSSVDELFALPVRSAQPCFGLL